MVVGVGVGGGGGGGGHLPHTWDNMGGEGHNLAPPPYSTTCTY